MAEFAKQVSDLPLYQELDRATGRDSIDSTEVARLKGLVTEVADTVGPALAQIPVTFRQYTVHDIRHCRNVIARMGDIIPAETREKLNALEISFLLLSALLHDVGMVVSDQEKSETLLSESFRRYKVEGHADRNKAIEEARLAGNEPRARVIEDALLAEYYRRLHPERVRQFMDKFLLGKFKYQEVDFAVDLARLCESHAWGVEESNDTRYPDKAIARLDHEMWVYGVQVNLQYLACILRLADILDFDRSRTPLAVFQHLDLTEPKSWEEWNKHLQVKGWKINPTQVAFEIPCAQPVFYVAVHEFLGWIDDELRDCRRLIENKPQVTADRYSLLLPQVVDRRKVRMADPSYIAGAFRFQLEYENILQLLMDKSLYPDQNLFLRELLQNALDACRRKAAVMEVIDLRYKPEIMVWDWSTDPESPRIVFQDNGIGMSLRIVEQYFLRVGRSYYRSPEFDAERRRFRERGKELDVCSQFGIGILSCFLVGDHLEVETYQQGNIPLRIAVEGPSKYFTIQRLPQPSWTLSQGPTSVEEYGSAEQTGTRITVRLRSTTRLDVREVLDTFAVNSDYPITVFDAQGGPQTVRSLRWEETVLARDCRFTKGGRQSPLFVNFRYSDQDASTVIDAPGLAQALVAMPIPFNQWKTSSHIRGQAWFWLLRNGSGEPSPQVGNLQVGLNLSLVGTPSLVANLDQFRRLYAPLQTHSIILKDVISKATDPEYVTTTAYDESHFDQLIRDWSRLTADERLQLEDIMAMRNRVLERGDPLITWVESPEVVNSLLDANVKWANRPVSFEPSMIGNYKEDERFALNSILIPAGVVKWSPARGVGKRLWLGTAFGGVRIDVRGSKAPIPAASRLFISEELAEDLLKQYLRASLRHGAELVNRYGGGAWRKWFKELWGITIDSGLDAKETLQNDGPFIAEGCRLAVVQNGKELHLSPSQIIEDTLRLHLGDRSPDAVELLLNDPINQILLPDFLSLARSRYLVDIRAIPFGHGQRLEKR